MPPPQHIDIALLNEYTPLEARLMQVLSDGEYHKRQELLDAMPEPEFRTGDSLKRTMFRLRPKLKRKGKTVTIIWSNGTTLYRLGRILVD